MSLTNLRSNCCAGTKSQPSRAWRRQTKGMKGIITSALSTAPCSPPVVALRNAPLTPRCRPPGDSCHRSSGSAPGPGGEAEVAGRRADPARSAREGADADDAGSFPGGIDTSRQAAIARQPSRRAIARRAAWPRRAGAPRPAAGVSRREPEAASPSPCW